MGEKALEQSICSAIKKAAAKTQIKQTIIGVATNVRETLCDIEREDAPTLLDVRFNAIDDDLQSFVTVYPKEGSKVIVGIIENLKTEAVVLRCSEVEKVSLKIGNTEMVIDRNGYKMERQGENLNNVLRDFVSEVMKIIVVQGTSPNVPALQQIQKRISKVLS